MHILGDLNFSLCILVGNKQHCMYTKLPFKLF